MNQGSWWAEAVNCQFAFTLPYFILHVTTSSRDLRNVQETVESPHQTEKPTRNNIIDVQICFTFLFTYPSRTFTDCGFVTPVFLPSRFPSRTLHGPSRTASFPKKQYGPTNSFTFPFTYPSRNFTDCELLRNIAFRTLIIAFKTTQIISERPLVFISKGFFDGSHVYIMIFYMKLYEHLVY